MLVNGAPDHKAKLELNLWSGGLIKKHIMVCSLYSSSVGLSLHLIVHSYALNLCQTFCSSWNISIHNEMLEPDWLTEQKLRFNRFQEQDM